MKRAIQNTVYEERTKRDMTQETLAQAVGVSRQTIIAIERGKYTPSVALAIRIAHTFDLQVEDVFELMYPILSMKKLKRS
jgi:putative transcriptional regulator